ncbi:polyprenyl synthetase family protein [bacterium]|nr:polyprenyl synthetase family protein [bacterium]
MRQASTFNLKQYLQDRAQEVDQALEVYLAPDVNSLGPIVEAMRYSVFPGGKRFRPVLALAACEALGCERSRAMAVACAFELIHCFSLVHDDLPCMDNDDERRGRPTNHKVYGEDVALLAGDGLSLWAFEVAMLSPDDLSASTLRALVRELVAASGHPGMVGGQVIDLAAQKTGQIDGPQLKKIHAAKTGALIRGAVRCGAIVAGASPEQLRQLTIYGEKIGLVFQITDDILDHLEDPEAVSYPALYGLDESRKMATEAVQEALTNLESFGPGAEPLRALATYLLTRTT